MNEKQIFLIAFALSLIGITPKVLKGAVFDEYLLLYYFFYIGLFFLVFYAINKFLWTSKPEHSRWLLFVMGFGCGYVLLAFFHLLLFSIQPSLLRFFLNLKEAGIYTMLIITTFRAFITQSIAFSCLFFFKNKEEKRAFQQEIDHLNEYLNDLKNNPIKKKEYKHTLITRFQGEVIPIEVATIACFHLSNGIVFQYLFSGQKYMQNLSLEKLEKDLDPNLFYRANRQFLIHKKAVEKVEQIENRKLKLILNQSLPEEIVISKVKSAAFIKWLEAP